MSDICPRCYPLLKGTTGLCREHTLEDALRPFVEASKRYENSNGDFAKAFHEVSVADIRRAASIDLPTTDYDNAPTDPHHGGKIWKG
jgi:hypothetical protein